MGMRSVVVLSILGLAPCGPSEPETPWWKGNLHTHSLWSDGDDYPEMILDGHKIQGYQFVALSDHNVLAQGDCWIDVSEGGGGPVLEAYRERFGEGWVEEREDDGAHLIAIRPEQGVSYRTRFIGTRRGYGRATEKVQMDGDDASALYRYSDEIGELLAEVEGTTPSYRFGGDEIYVRAKIVSTRLKENPYREGEHEAAWVQPVVLAP